MAYTQENRVMAIETPLGQDELLLAEFHGTESVSRLYRFELTLFSENHNIVFEDIIGKNVTIRVLLADGSPRYINGIIAAFAQQRGGGESASGIDLAIYTATLVPWFWLLTRCACSRIFQNLAVPDIFEKVLSGRGFQDYKLQLHGSYDIREYCVQYRETDFNFLSRLLEEEGIYYFFEHEHGKHALVLADMPEDHKPCPKQEQARYQLTAGTWLDEDVITALEKRQEITVSKYALADYNFKMPGTDLKVEASSQQALAPKELELYDYPGIYEKRAGGERRSHLRMQEEEARITAINGVSNCRAFASGYRFDLKDHYRTDLADKSFVLTQVDHHASEEESYLAGSTDSAFKYSNNFKCIPFEVPFRPLRLTPKPLVQGSQTAIVTGPSGEEIYTDEHGRVKVQFHWDREGKKDDKTSCWIRVSQAWAGAGWGAMTIPRIGHEVIVDFLEGDPDRPIIIGRVYHGINKPPYGLPGDKTKSTLKSDSSKGGGGSNELRFEDKKGAEEIYLHGQKDWTIGIENDKNQTVGNNETLSVGTNRDKSVGSDQSETIGANKKIQVGSNHDETIGVNKTMKVGANHTENIGANMSQSVGSAKTETIAAAKALTIGAAYQVSVGGAMNESVGAAKGEQIAGAKVVAVGAHSSENVLASKSVNVGKDISESAGSDVSWDAGKKMSLHSGDDFSVKGDKKGVIEIKDQLTIKVGKASITLKKNGDIIIDGKNINIKGSGNIVMKAKKIMEN